MIVMNDEMRFNENDRSNMKRMRGPIGAHSLGVMGEVPRRGVAHKVGAIEGGRYVPDEINVETCLSCTRKKCTGYCKKLRAPKQAKEDEA